MNRSQFSLFVFFLFAFAACRKEGMQENEESTVGQLAPAGFNYSTSKSVSIKVRLLSPINEPLKGLLVNFKSASGNDVFLQGATDQDGYFSATLNVPSQLDSVVIEHNYVGLVDQVTAVFMNNKLNCVIGGSKGLSGDVVFPATVGSTRPADKFTNPSSVFAGTVFTYMGTFDESGRPNYLDPTPSPVSAQLLSYVNASLPQGKDIRVHHPQYIDGVATQNLNILENSDVYVSFVAEDARNLNSIGYYTYKTDNPPKTAADISEIKYIFPNASGVGGGGNMIPGDRVKLGTFSKGTSVAFVLFQNAWRSTTRDVRSNALKFYTTNTLNPETNEFLKIHSVLLEYKPDNIFVVGFEDANREGSSDHDFNDVLLFATATPNKSISEVEVRELDYPGDRDGDGVRDAADLFPDDPTKAYATYFPSSLRYGTLLFEDRWPQEGDYDMNDLVVKYKYKMVANAANRFVEMAAELIPVAAGATYYNGLGIQFPFASAKVQSVTGYRLKNNYVTLNANGTEAGHDKAVIVAFDNHEAFLRHVDGSFLIQTVKSAAESKVIADTARINIKFSVSLSSTELGQAPFNPFLISNMRRGYEIHLPGYEQTAKANTSLFGAFDDVSNIAAGKFYVTKVNSPWAINILDNFDYPKEEANISSAYLHYSEWALSGGLLYKDWYSNTSAGYRDASKIFR